MKYSDVTLGRIEAVWNKLGGEEGVEKFLRGELVVTKSPHRWREENGVIYLSPLCSDGTIGPLWIPRLEGQGFQIEECAKYILRSPDFTPTSGVTTEVAILRDSFFKEGERTTRNIRVAAHAGTFTPGRYLSDPSDDLACLIRESYSDEEIEAMGLWSIVAMHRPINDSYSDPRLLGVERLLGGGRRLSTHCDGPDLKWGRLGIGFAFVLFSTPTEGVANK